MHFLFFAAQYLPTVGGVERYTHSLAHTLAGLGHRATVVTSALPGLPADEEAGGVRVVRLPARLLMNGRFPVPKKNSAFRRAAKALFTHQYDLAVINTRFYPLCLWAAKKCKKKGVPALVVEHGTKHLSLDNKALDVVAGLYEHAAMGLMRRRCADFYGVSLACNAWLKHFKVQAKGVLYNAIDVENIRAMAKNPAADFRARYDIEKDAPLVVYSGRFIREKGIWELLDGFALLRAHLPGATLIMAGDGPLLEAVRTRDQEGVVAAGSLPYRESVALLAQSDVFCLPTYSEGFSNVILEAAAAGCCIITTPTGGSPELISNGESGILLEEISPAAIVAALREALEDPLWRRAAGMAVRHEVATRFTWKNTADGLLKIAKKDADE